MGNKSKSGRPKKKKFQGNQHTTNDKSSRSRSCSVVEEPIVDSGVASASAQKIRRIEEETNVEGLREEGDVCRSRSNDSVDLHSFILMNAQILCSFLEMNMRCVECCEFSLRCELSSKKQGFFHEIIIRCSSCEWESSIESSGESSTNGHKEVNLRMVSFVRSIGKGYSALEKFSLYTNSPRPMTKNCYRRTFNKIHSACKEVAEESMKGAVEEVKTKKREKNSEVDLDEENVDCGVSLDETWQRRGYSSHHGVVTAISMDNSKCLDAEILSNICKGCQHWDRKKNLDEDRYMRWKLHHSCKINHIGTAGAMESVGSVRIFGRSEIKKGLRYTEYLGDGDAAAYRKVVNSSPYGEDVEITKLECVGHVQKRLGTRLRRLKNENKHLKLEDGKGLAGAGRLTDKMIDTLQNYYGFAIRQNAGDLAGMKRAVRAVLPHVASSNENKMHEGCPEGPDSWCKYKTDPENYKHKKGLPKPIVEFIKPVFEDLANEKLLKKCLHGKTQNVNECLNKLIWDRCAKENYVEKSVIEEAVYSAISYFNDGAQSVTNMFCKLGISSVGIFTREACARRNSERVYYSDRKSNEIVKKRRKTLRAIRKGFQDKAIEAEGDLYSPGGH